MTSEHAAAHDPEERLGEVLAAYLHASEAGQAPPRQDLLARYPDLADELEAFFAGRDQFARLAAPLRSVVEAADPQPAAPLGCLEDYELLEEIAAGGMGVVYKARQKSLHRLVAVKMIRAGELAAPADVQRFRNEAELVAQLDHPHIVPIYEVGEQAGRPYFSMKLMEGGSLAGQLACLGADPRSAARLLVPIAQAVHYAHQRGILHRDLKPSNILLDADGQPHVADFGLAKRVQADRSLTESGALVGTPGYMAPEQAAGKKEAITTATDVYGLGAVLYALLTGRPPFRAETVFDTLAQVRECEPEPPGRINPKVDRDLETICLKCLDKEPPRRYRSAEALAEDLGHWLAGEPIEARPISRTARLGRWARRNPLVAWLTATALGLLVAVAVVATVGYLQTKAALKLAEDEKRAAEEKTAEEQRQRKRTEATFGKALNGISDFVLKLEGKEWSHVPQRAAIQEALLEHELTCFRSFLADNSDDPMVRVETAWAHDHVGIVYWRLADHTKAEKAFRTALAILEEREADFCTIPEYVGMLGQSYNRLGWELYDTGRNEEATEAFRKEMAYHRLCLQLNPDMDACNGFALSLCLCPIVRFRDPALAVELAARAVKLAPQVARYWNTLGMARYRAGEWKAAVAALEKAMELRRDGNHWHFFYLAMAHWQLSDEAESQHCYRKGVEHMDKLIQIGLDTRYTRAEAGALLGIKDAPISAGKEKPAPQN